MRTFINWLKQEHICKLSDLDTQTPQMALHYNKYPCNHDFECIPYNDYSYNEAHLRTIGNKFYCKKCAQIRYEVDYYTDEELNEQAKTKKTL